MNRVDSGWSCRLTTQPFSIDPRANMPRTDPNRQRPAHSHSLYPLLLSQISRRFAYVDSGLHRLQHHVFARIWPFKHFNKDTRALTDPQLRENPVHIRAMATNETRLCMRLSMRRRMRIRVLLRAIATKRGRIFCATEDVGATSPCVRHS